MNGMITYEDILKLWQGFKIEDSKALDAYLDHFAVVFSYHSGAIENPAITYRDTHEIFDHGEVTGYTGDLRTLYEIKNMKDAYNLMSSWFDSRTPITKDTIRQMHFELTKGTYDERRWELGERPGEFKKQDVWGVGLHDVAAPVNEIEHDLDMDLAEISDVDDKNALVAAAFFHARFEGIHAFADGNGRTGRAMMNYFLLLHNHPPIVVHQEDRKQYYSALDRFDEDGALESLIAFLKSQTVKTWEKTAQRYAASHER